MVRTARRPRRSTSMDRAAIRCVRRPPDGRPPTRGRARRHPGTTGSRLSDRLAVACVGAGCAGIPSVVLVEFINHTPVGLTAIGAIAVAAFSASGYHTRHRDDRRR